MVTVGNKISRAVIYLEPDIHDIASRVAEARGESLSAWTRRLVLTELLAKGEISQETLLKLVTA